MPENAKGLNHDKLEELTQLTGELAHEIKNPLSTIKVNLKLISEDLEDSSAAQQGAPVRNEQKFARALRKLAVVRKETDRLEQTLDGFLRYVGRPELQLEEIDINSLVSDMIDFYSAQAHTHRITIREGFGSGPLVCKVDVGMLKQVILNLFINSQQAMEGGGDLMIRTAKQSECAVLQVADTGRGIPADRLCTLFQPYHSLRPGGTGLGLATAKKIIEAHKGSIEVHSEPGRGVCFTIKLPLVADRAGSSEVPH